MADFGPNDFKTSIKSIGKRLKELRIGAGYKSYEVFAWEHSLSRIQYWKMEQGTNCTLKSLYKVLKIHQLSYQEFFASIDDRGCVVILRITRNFFSYPSG